MSPSSALSPLPIKWRRETPPRSISRLHWRPAAVLLIDFDPQGNASTGLGIDDRAHNSYSLIAGSSGSMNRSRKPGPRLDIIPTVVDLSAAELGCPTCRTGNFGFAVRYRAFRRHMTTSHRLPRLGMLTVNALAAATSVLVPLQCEFYGGCTADAYQCSKGRIEWRAFHAGHRAAMFDGHNKLSAMVAKDVRDHFAGL